MTKEKVTYESLTSAQKYALYRSVESHYRKIGDGVQGQEKRTIRLYNVAGSTSEALERKGLATRARANYYTNYWDLTPAGVKLGVQAFEDHRDGLEPKEWAKELAVEKAEIARKADEEVEAISNLFTGMTVKVENDGKKKKEKLNAVLFRRLRHNGDGASLSSDEWRQVGEQIRNMVP